MQHSTAHNYTRTLNSRKGLRTEHRQSIVLGKSQLNSNGITNKYHSIYVYSTIS